MLGKNEMKTQFSLLLRIKQKRITFFILSILLYLFQLNTIYFIKKTEGIVYIWFDFQAKQMKDGVDFLFHFTAFISYFWNLWFLVNTPFPCLSGFVMMLFPILCFLYLFSFHKTFLFSCCELWLNCKFWRFKV